jgi:hypothetical protein
VLPPERLAEFRLAHTLATDTNDLGILHALLRAMSERLGRRLRRGGLAAGRLRVEATYADHTSVARAVPLRAAALDVELADAARRAFTLANTRRLAVRAVAVMVDRLVESDAQLELWTERAGRQGGRGAEPAHRPASESRNNLPPCPPAPRPPQSRALQSALDRIRTRYDARALGINSAPPPAAPPAVPR